MPRTAAAGRRPTPHSLRFGGGLSGLRLTGLGSEFRILCLGPGEPKEA